MNKVVMTAGNGMGSPVQMIFPRTDRAMLLPSSLLVGLIVSATALPARALAQTTTTPARGIEVQVELPLTGSSVDRLIGQLKTVAKSTPSGTRQTIVVTLDRGADRSVESGFEDALKLARAMTSDDLRRLRLVAWVKQPVRGHVVMVLLACDTLLVSPGASIGEATTADDAVDETIGLTYRAITKRRALFPAELVDAMVDPSLELARATTVDGTQVWLSGDELDRQRKSGKVVSEVVVSEQDQPLSITAQQLRSWRIAAAVIGDADNLLQQLDLAELEPLSSTSVIDQPQGVLLEIAGSIAVNRSRRWQSNLASSLESGETNTWLIAIDSSGGSLSESASLAASFVERQPPLQQVVGVVRGEARGDSALLAIACQPLYLLPDARLGGPGSDAMSGPQIQQASEIIDLVAEGTGRPPALVRGLLDPSLAVYRYTNKRTGQVLYETEAGLVDGEEDPQLARDRWTRGERIELSDGLTAQQAIELGLAEDEVQSLDEASKRTGFDQLPPALSDRGLVQFVERIGRSNMLAFLLLTLGFVMLSSEASAPGLGFPGFLAMVCFAFFFWIKFLAGTAEWLELIAFVLGLVCIGIEIFVVPGFGVFGIGGLAMTLLAVVLMSQTFVIPRNVYQLGVLTQGLWIALGSLAGMIGGVILMRTLMPNVPVLRGLVMESPDAVAVDLNERLADFGDLLGRQGVSSTPLRPSGKARFGDQIVAVVSDGAMIESDQAIRVIEVQGNRIVVEAMDS